MVADFARDLADGAITLDAPSDQLMRNSAAEEGAFALALSISLQRLGENKYAKNGR